MTDLSKAGDTLGYPAFVPASDELRYLHNQRLGKVIFTQESVGKEFIFRCLCSHLYRREILASASGSTVRHTSPSKILDHRIVISENQLEVIFEKYSSEITSKKASNVAESTVLASLRDTLLPKLLSGQLRIPEAKKRVAEVL